MDLFLDWQVTHRIKLHQCVPMNKDKGKERISLILSLFSYEKKGILENSNFNGKILKLIAFYRIGIFVISYVRKKLCISTRKKLSFRSNSLRNNKKHKVFSTSSILIHKTILFSLSSPRSFSRSNTWSLGCSRVSGPLLVSIERLSRAALAPFRIELPRFPPAGKVCTNESSPAAIRRLISIRLRPRSRCGRVFHNTFPCPTRSLFLFLI